MSFLHPSFPSIGDFWGTFGSAPLLWAFHRFGCGPNLRHPHHGRSHHPNPKSTSVWDFSERGGNQPEDFLADLCPTQKKIGCEILMAQTISMKESFLTSYPPPKKKNYKIPMKFLRLRNVHKSSNCFKVTNSKKKSQVYLHKPEKSKVLLRTF